MTREEFVQLVREHAEGSNGCGCDICDWRGNSATAALLAAYDALAARLEDAEEDARDQRLRADQAEYAVVGYPPHEEVAAFIQDRERLDWLEASVLEGDVALMAGEYGIFIARNIEIDVLAINAEPEAVFLRDAIDAARSAGAL